MWAVGRAARAGLDAASVALVLSRAVIGVVVLAAVGVVITMAAFLSIPLDSWDETGTPHVPAWLSVDVAITPAHHAASVEDVVP